MQIVLNKQTIRFFFFLSLLSSWTVFGAVVTELMQDGKIKVDVSGTNLKSGEVVCLVRQNKKIGCGLLAVAKKGISVISLDFQNESPKVGDEVITAAALKQREKGVKAAVSASAALGASTEIQESDYVRYSILYRHHWNFGGVMNWDLDQYSAGVQLEHFFTGKVSYALQATFYDVTKKYTTLDGMSFSIHRIFRPSREYSGVLVGLGLGTYIFNAPSKSNQVELSAQGYIGWSARLTKYIRLGPTVGLMLVTRPKGYGGDVDHFYVLKPIFNLHLSVVL